MSEQKTPELQETPKLSTTEINVTTPTSESNSPTIEASSSMNTSTLIKSESIVSAPSTPNIVNIAYNGNTQIASLPQYQITQNAPGSKFNQLLGLIDELGKEIRPTYAGNRNSTEKLKRGILHGRTLARECLLEVEKNARQQHQQQQQQQQQQ